MFFRLWSGLPKDPMFPSDLHGLGLFINEIDEIRQTSDPKFYFKFFTYKNERWNERQRFHMNEAVQKVVFQRLQSEGLVKTLLPLGTDTTDLAKPHVPIFTSADLDRKSRVILIFGESCQDLGLLAHRVAGGAGGVNKGSMVSIVRAIKDAFSSTSSKQSSNGVLANGNGEHAKEGENVGDDEAPEVPGIILANSGQLWWWPEGQRTVGPVLRHMAPMKSAVHQSRHTDEEKNAIPGNRNPEEHVRYIFEQVVRNLVSDDAKLDIIAVGDMTDVVEKYLGSEEIWSRWNARINSMAIVGGFFPATNIQAHGFRDFIKNRARAWVANTLPLDTPISRPEGNQMSTSFTGQGCPVFSAGNALFAELLLVETHESALRWIAEVDANYKNPEIDPVVEVDVQSEDEEDSDSHPWPEYAAQEAGREEKWRAEAKQKQEEEAARAKKKADDKAAKQQALMDRINAEKEIKQAKKKAADEAAKNSAANNGGEPDPLKDHPEMKAQLRERFDMLEEIAMASVSANPSLLPKEEE